MTAATDDCLSSTAKSLCKVEGLHGHRLGLLQSCCCGPPGHCSSMGSLKQFSKHSMATGITGGIRVRISRICSPPKSRSCLCLSIGTCLPCVWCTLHSTLVFRVPCVASLVPCQLLFSKFVLLCWAVLLCVMVCCAVLCCSLPYDVLMRRVLLFPCCSLWCWALISCPTVIAKCLVGHHVGVP